jgi:arylsulfatase
MEVYAAMVDSMDQGIGKIVQALEATNQFNNTLVCYMQDNGGCAEGMGRRNVGKPRASTPSFPPMKPDTLQMDMIPKQTRDGYPVRQGKGVLAGPADTYIGYGQAWATVSNTPFRKYKHWVHEGGIATPLIVHWPRGIVDPGRMEKTPSHLIDIMATAVDIADADYPKNKTPLEGMSLQPLFQKKFLPKRELYWEHEGNRAIRNGNWKLVAGFNQPWELYDISSDRSEQHDLSNKQIDRAKNMAEAWDAYAARAQVISWENFRSKKNSKAKKK